MSDLINLIFKNGQIYHCISLNEAKSKAITSKEVGIIVEITPRGIGGPMTTLEFDQSSQDWIPE